MWLKTLQQWLGRERLIPDERWAEELRAERDRNELALRKAEATAWYLPPPC